MTGSDARRRFTGTSSAQASGVAPAAKAPAPAAAVRAATTAADEDEGILFGGPLGTGAIMLFSHVLVLYLYYCNVKGAGALLNPLAEGPLGCVGVLAGPHAPGLALRGVVAAEPQTNKRARPPLTRWLSTALGARPDPPPSPPPPSQRSMLNTALAHGDLKQAALVYTAFLVLQAGLYAWGPGILVKVLCIDVASLPKPPPVFPPASAGRLCPCPLSCLPAGVRHGAPVLAGGLRPGLR